LKRASTATIQAGEDDKRRRFSSTAEGKVNESTSARFALIQEIMLLCAARALRYPCPSSPCAPLPLHVSPCAPLPLCPAARTAQALQVLGGGEAVVLLEDGVEVGAADAALVGDVLDGVFGAEDSAASLTLPAALVMT